MKSRESLRIAALAIALLSIAASSLPAAAGGYYRKGTFAMGGGFNFPVQEADDYLNSSGSFFVGGGRHINRDYTVQVEWTHNWLGIDPDIFDSVENDSTHYDNAYASSWSMTLNLMRRFKSDGDIVPWITGGGGYYKRNLQITENALVYYPPIWDPWWGWIDGGWAEGEVITGNRETSGFGYNIGGGIDLQIENGASLFLDIRYHHAIVDGVDVTLIPVMAGIRW